MAIAPAQTRSVDPWHENRFTNTYNLRSRLFTGGQNIIVFPESFKLRVTDPISTSFSIDPGITITNDVLIHITESKTIDLSTEASGLLIDSPALAPIPYLQSITPALTEDVYLHVVITYKYARSIEPQVAQYNIIYDLNNFNETKHTYVGRIKIDISGETYNAIIAQNTPGITQSEEQGEPVITIVKPQIVDPISGYSEVNGGVVRASETNDDVDSNNDGYMDTGQSYEGWYY